MADQEPFDVLAANPAFQNFAKQSDELFNTTLSKEIAASRGSNPSLELTKSQVPSGEPINLKSQAFFGGNFATGPAPALKNPEISSRQYAEQVSNLLGDPNSWDVKGTEYAKPYAYNTGLSNINFDRYYNHPKFAALGWSPYRDNELVYNQNSSWWDDFERMRGQFVGLAGQGFKSMYGWTSSDSQKFDREIANEFTRKMGVMNSSKEGFGASLTNFAGNAAYTVGIMSSFLLEEAAIWGATAATGGLLAGVSVPASMASFGRMMKGVSNLSKPLKAVEAEMTGAKAISEINNISKARQLFDYAKKIVPFEGTASFLGQGAKMFENTTDFAKLKDFAFVANGTGALYRDLRAINAVMAESDLEGGMVRNEMTNDLVNQYYEQNNKSPEGPDAEKIYAAANEAGLQTRMANIPAIYLSNKLVFGKMLKGWRPNSTVLTDMVKGGIKGGTMVFNKEGKAEILKGVSRFGKGIYWKQGPARLLKNSLRYGKANLAEGIQEWSQEVISDQAKDYYNHIYADPNLAGNRQFWGSLNKGVQNQLSGRGAEVFLSGFFMGGLVQGPQNLIFNTLNEKYTEYKSPEQFKKQTEARTEFENNIINAYNATKGKGVVPFFNVIEQNMVSQINLEKQMSQAEINKDRKEVEDIKDESLFTHMNTLYRNGGADHFISQLEAMKELSPEELKEAFPEGAADGDRHNSDLFNRIDNVVNRAKQLKFQQEEVDRRFPNPYNPGQYSSTDQIAEFVQESIDHYAFEEAKKHAVFANYGFTRALERIHSLVGRVGGRDKPLANIDAADITALFNAEQLTDKIKTMNSEIDVYGKGTPEQKILAEKLKAKRDSMKSVGVAMANYLKIADGIKTGKIKTSLAEAATDRPVPSYSNEYTIAAEAIDNLEKAYFDHVRILGKQSKEHVLDEKIAPSFEALIDYMELDSDSKGYAKSINILFDPKGFQTMTDAHKEVLKTVYDQREQLMRDAYQKYLDIKDKNELLVSLGKAGVWIKAEDVEEFNNGEFTKVKFFSVTKPYKEILPGSDKFKTDIQPKLEAYLKVSGKTPIEEVKVEEPVATTAPITTEPVATTPVATVPGAITLDMTFEQMDTINPAVSAALKKYITGFVNLHIANDSEKINLEDPTSYGPALQKSAMAARILESFNNVQPVVETVVAPVKEEVKEEIPAKIIPTATIGTPGSIVYASPTTGKSTLAKEFPELYVDGDQLLADFLKDPNNRDAFPFMENIDTLMSYIKSKKLNISKENAENNLAQQAGLIFSTVQDNEIYEDEIKELFTTVAGTTKIVLTSNQFAIPWASEVYLIEQSAKSIPRIADEFKKRVPGLGRSRAEQDANRIMSLERTKTKGLKITEVPFNKHLKDFLTVEPVKISTEVKDLIAQAETVEDLDEILANVIEKMTETDYLEKQALTSDDVYKLIDTRKEELGLAVEFENISEGDILIMKDRKKYGYKGMVRVVKKNAKSLVLIPEDNKDVKFTLPSSAKDRIAYVYKKGQVVAEVTAISPEAEKKSEESVKNLEDTTVLDVAAALKEIEGKTVEQVKEEFKNKPKPEC